MSLAQNLRLVEARLAGAAARSGRPACAIRLLPATKTQPPERLLEALAAGYDRFGENRTQELADKAAALAQTPASWEVIGHLQTNKAKTAVKLAVAVQSLDSLKLAAALQRACQDQDRLLDVLIEVNTSGEDSKFGLPPAALADFSRALRAYDRLRPRGLMTLARPGVERAQVAPCFETLADCRERLRQRDGGGWDELSMGMSGDFEWAVELGSTCVRLGTAIFGLRADPARG
ncbi:MAG: YggS family pyridoxal phosphate-dependent enzyme [Propionibacteriaceae bacterium]|jgi:pyridoxal phosphate enzyme (YggS family)|nr:YggS family pyridoxal phosphate-dependent enzyme [Propionibacteriaceae bacterium]